MAIPGSGSRVSSLTCWGFAADSDGLRRNAMGLESLRNSDMQPLFEKQFDPFPPFPYPLTLKTSDR